MRATGDILRHMFAPCDHFYIADTHICVSRTNVARLSHQSLANSSSTYCTAFARQSCDIRETLARCSQNDIAHTYHQRPSHTVLANVVRLSLKARALVARWFSCEKLMNNKQQTTLQQSFNLQTLTTTSRANICYQENAF